MTSTSAIHPNALCLGEVGVGTEVRAFAVVEIGCVLGDTCIVAAGAKILSGAHVETKAVVGENAVVAERVVIGRGAVVEPGAFVSESVPANAVVQGNPAVIVGYAGSELNESPPIQEPQPADSVTRASRVLNVRVHRLARGKDLRGSLMAVEFESLPFAPARVFTVSEVSSERIRGSHAHRECEQFLICGNGAVSCVVDDGESREEFRLEGSEIGIYVPAMTWGTQYKYSADAVLLVLASHAYDADDYIRDYDEFLRLVAEQKLVRDRSGGSPGS